jgi:hypothetical protein
LLQYQMPRSHTQRPPPESHCDSPTLVHCEPIDGSEETVEHRLFALVVPPVDELPPVDVLPPVVVEEVPPVLLPPVDVLPPADVLLPPVLEPPPTWPLPPAEVLPPTELPPPTWPPSVDVPPPVPAALPPVSVVAAGFWDVPQPTLKAVSAPSSVTLNRPSVLM